MQGLSFAPVLQGAVDTAPPSDRWLFWEFQGHRAARHGKWKIVDDETTGPWQLYDMESDRTESHDLAGANRSIVTEMSSAWDAWKQRVGVRTWTAAHEYRPA
jgi:arylsulfatase